jgi:hypothetical protein
MNKYSIEIQVQEEMASNGHELGGCGAKRLVVKIGVVFIRTWHPGHFSSDRIHSF